MKTLYIDTSSNFLYTAIVEDNNLIAEVKKEYGHELSKYALPDIVGMFESTNTEPKSIERIIVVNGPGSFTGIRIGITIAKTYAWSLNIPITTITSLEAMMLSCKVNKYYVPAIDARRGYVFSAIYSDKKEQILAPCHIKIEDLEQKLKDIDDYIIVTNDEVEITGEKTSYDPDIKLIVDYFKDKENINPHAVNPDYLKLTEAEESKLND